MQVEGYDIDILVTGYPGKSVCHGSLGWSTIVLVRHGDRAALIDVGSFGQRRLLLERLRALDLAPGDVTDVLLTHSHYDHSINWTLFPKARVVIGADELAWSLEQPWGETPVPELYVRELERRTGVHRSGDAEEVFPGLTAYLAPGHTPGHLIFVLRGEEHDLVFTGDAAKNRAELLSRRADMTLDAGQSAASFDAIWRFWTSRPGSVLIPGHDLPMVLDDGVPRYLGEREAAIRAWFAEDLDRTTLIELTVS